MEFHIQYDQFNTLSKDRPTDKEQTLAEERDRKVYTDLVQELTEAVKSSQPAVSVVNEPVPGIDKLLSVLAEIISA